jgi:hypothetical protein
VNTTLKELTECAPATCVICGEKVLIPHGAMGFNLRGVPEPTYGRVMALLERFENKEICWRCTATLIWMIRLMQEHRGDLEAVTAALASQTQREAK